MKFQNLFKIKRQLVLWMGIGLLSCVEIVIIFKEQSGLRGHFLKIDQRHTPLLLKNVVKTATSYVQKHVPERASSKILNSSMQLIHKKKINIKTPSLDHFHEVQVTCQIAIVLTHVGLDARLMPGILSELPATITLAFAPSSDNLTACLQQAHTRGHTCLLMIPMEPLSYPQIDPGMNTLLTNLDANENLKRFTNFIKNAPGCVGVMNDYGSKFMMSAVDYTPIMASIKQQNLILFENTAVSPLSCGQTIAVQQGVTMGTSSYYIQRGLSQDKILQQLEALTLGIKRQGNGIIIAEAYPVMIEALHIWSQNLKAKKVEIVPLSTLVLPLE